MPATSRVYTLRHAARLLDETEDTVSEAAISMFLEDGAIQVIDDDFGDEDWALTSAFTDEGLENLRYIIDETRLDGLVASSAPTSRALTEYIPDAR